MDNPQYYQPLSHALDPSRSTSYTSTARTYGSEHTARPSTSTHRPEHNDPEDSDQDEGIVEEQLARNDTGSDPASPQPKTARQVCVPENHSPQSVLPPTQQEPEKRRPGRPRGSKNRRGRPPSAVPITPTLSKSTYDPPSQLASGSGSNPPLLPEVNAQNQGYYEFQWRVLNLCAEFYGAAEQLLKATSPLVIAQCYQAVPGNKLDPLVMLTEAKTNCDTLLANPSKLITNPPPSMYTTATTAHTPAQPSQPAVTATTSSSSPSSKSPTVISQPQSFVVSMGAPMHYPVYPGAYPATSFYQYPYGQPYYAPAPIASTTTTSTAPQTSTAAIPVASTPTMTTTATSTPAVTATASSGNQGAWSEEEVNRLRKLSADARAAGHTGDAEWTWVVNQWGVGRTRRQILAKAQTLGLKESTSRGVKRRRENDGNDDAPASATSGSNAPTPSLTAATVPVNPHLNTTTPSPGQSQAGNTPVASPSIQNLSRPATTKPPSSVSITPAPISAVNTMPWPMPTVAANTVSPVLGSANTADQRTTSFYRPRPTASDTTHKFVYQNGRTSTDSGK
ncbi:hypothetical protein D9758_003938 [Tetrapyrgos nigripes]|uniref:Myb-like domain-containing protein n=1 Tax=Tetrapyrgos nigripes TaxID=182062 RepID=A0A8H5GLR3_9AGAR|nr:hypothetical protein D9758_003938 [Tetrapyrgos nigripes]